MTGEIKKILIVSNTLKSVINFRYHLIKKLVAKNYQVLVCASPNKEKNLMTLLGDEGARCIPIFLKPTSVNLFSDLRYFFSLYRIIKFERPDIVLNYTIKPVIYGSLVAQLARVKNIYSTITGLGYVFVGRDRKAKLLRMLVKPLYRLALKFNRKIFFQNSDDPKLFIDYQLTNRKKICTIPGSGVDLKYFNTWPVPTSFSFLFLGRLLKDKGIVEYLLAAKFLKRKYPHVKFVLAGSCDANPSSLTLDDLGPWISEGSIEYLGYLTDVRFALANCSVFVLPSYREGMPRSVLEAMASGRPIITTDAPGCRDTVQEGVNGFLIRPRCVDELIIVMERFINHPELIPQMGKESRRIAEEKYDVHKVNKIILETIS